MGLERDLPPKALFVTISFSNNLSAFLLVIAVFTSNLKNKVSTKIGLVSTQNGANGLYSPTPSLLAVMHVVVFKSDTC